MALQVWLPLNGNLNNQGLNNTTFTGSTTFEAGKLGQAGVFGTAAKRAISSATVTLKSQVTIAFWIKIKTWVNWGRIFNLYNSDKTNTISCVSNTSTDKRIGTQVSKNGTKLTDSYNGSFDLNTWYHFTMVVDGTTKQHYINGSLVGTATLSDSMVTTNYTVMCGGTADSGTPVDMDINDFRVYDTALSPKEIEILSRGLVAHYPLNNNGGGQPNLYDFESVASKWAEDGLTRRDYSDDVYGNILKVSSGSTQSSNFRICREVSNVWNSGQTYTVSFLAKASKSATVRVSRSVADYAPNFTVGTTWKRYSGQINCTTTATGGTLSIQLATLSTDLYITQVKLELGDKATVYCPGVGDSHYIPLGYNSTTEYDVSGYKYNGTRNGTFSWNSDTPRYLVSSVFTNNNANHISLGSQTLNMSNITFSVWFKVNTAYQWSRIFDFGASEGVGYCIGLALGSNGTTLTLYGRRGSASATLPDKQIQSISLNTWYHVAISISGATCNCYVNGELKVSHNFTTAYPENTTFNYCYVGKSVYSADKALDGQVSDFRIYATALSDTQVAELYNTAVSVANNGTLMGYELVEV